MEDQSQNPQKPQNSKFALITSIIIVLIVFILGFIFFARVEHRVEENNTPLVNEDEKIAVAHQYMGGAHTFIGNIAVPTPCYSVSADALVLESYPEQVIVRIETKEEGDICAQVITEKKFKVSFQSSEDAVIKATLNGSPVTLQITEALADVNLEATPIE